VAIFHNSSAQFFSVANLADYPLDPTDFNPV